MDSDDVLSVGALETLYARVKAEQLDLLCFAADSFYSGEDYRQLHRQILCPIPGNYSLCSGPQLFTSLMRNHVEFFMAWTKLFRTDFLRENGISTPEGVLHEDILFSLEALLKAKRANVCHNVLYYHRYHRHSITGSPYDINNLYGILRSYTGGIALLSGMELSYDVLKIAYDYLLFGIRNAHRIYHKDLNKAEQELFWQICPKDQVLTFYTAILFAQKNSSTMSLATEVDRLQQQSDYLQGKINLMENSKAYRLGKALTAIPRALRNAFRKIRR